MQPDFPITPTIDDVLQKRDAELEFTLDLIRKKKSSAASYQQVLQKQASD